MKTNLLEIKTKLQIQKPPSFVFESIVNPERMSEYFISRGSGRLESGKEIFWRFPEFDFEFPIHVDRVDPEKYVSFFWQNEGTELLVEIKLEQGINNSTVVTVTERGKENNEEGLKWLKSNTEGWANFLACLKAYAEYGINLRKGAFDFMSDKSQ